MKTRDMILDVLSDVDEKYIEEHAKRIRPAKRGTRYAMAAAGYVAACLVVALLIPLITGNPGDVAPSVSPGSQGVTPGGVPDDNPIGIPETYPDAVTVDEVYKMVDAAKAACDANSIIVLSDGTELVAAKIPGNINSINKVEYYACYLYLENVQRVLQDMMNLRFPRESIYLASELPTHIPNPDYYYLDLENTVFVDAEDAFEKISSAKDDVVSVDDVDLDEEPVAVRIYKDRVNYVGIGTSEDMTVLFPSDSEQKTYDDITDIIDIADFKEYKTTLVDIYAEEGVEKVTTAELVRDAYEAANETSETATPDYPDAVTEYEVYKMIDAARDACNRVGTVVLSDGTELACAEKTNLTREDVLNGVEEEEMYKYALYMENVEALLLDMLMERLPENSIRLKGEDAHSRSRDFFFLDLEGDGYTSAEEAYEKGNLSKFGLDDSGFFRFTMISYWDKYGAFQLHTTHDYSSVGERLFPLTDENTAEGAILTTIDTADLNAYKASLAEEYVKTGVEKISTADIVRDAYEAAKNGPAVDDKDKNDLLLEFNRNEVCTKDYVEEFVEAANKTYGKYGDTYFSNYVFTAEKCYNVTPKAVSDCTDIKIFKCSDPFGSFIMIDGEVFDLCWSFGGFGFSNAYLWDYDNNGDEDLLVTYSWGSGMTRTEIMIFNTTTKESIDVCNPCDNNCCLFGYMDTGFACVETTAGDSSNGTEEKSFDVYILNGSQLIGRISYENGSFVCESVKE